MDERIYTSYWGNPELPRINATTVAISRGKPRWRLPFTYRVLGLLAPSKEVFAMEDMEKFETAYVAGLEEIGAERIAAELGRISDQNGGKPLVLLCFEPIGVPCHRLVFGEWWKEKTGQQAPELLPGMVPLSEDMPAQEALF
jgi:hypothetical protein